MTADEIRAFLKGRGVNFTEGAVQNGVQFRCRTKEIFNVFETGAISFQGKQTPLTAEVKALAGETTEAPVGQARIEVPAPVPAAPAQPIFIVYGHDTQARNDLELLLRRMGLDPIILGRLPAAGDTIIEKLERYLGEHGNVGFACVLLTPDDEGYRAGEPDQKRYRARQNVVLEMGMVLARLGRRRVAILHKQSIELPSDIAGLIWIGFQERLDEAQTQLFNELREAGYTGNERLQSEPRGAAHERRFSFAAVVCEARF